MGSEGQLRYSSQHLITCRHAVESSPPPSSGTTSASTVCGLLALSDTIASQFIIPELCVVTRAAKHLAG
jgi:hypothetical protein